MLMKIGDVTATFGISHRSLHYWESVGILRSERGDNDYRYYGKAEQQKIRQIVLLRKLRLSIPSIQEIFASRELSKVIAVFTAHLDETQREKDQLHALGVVLRQLIHMIRDRQSVDSVYRYLATTYGAESEELKSALQTVFSEPAPIAPVPEPAQPLLDLSGVDLALERMAPEDAPEVERVIRRCYAGVEEIEILLKYFDFEHQLHMPDCACYEKILQGGACVGAINLAYVGREAMLIRCLAYSEPDFNRSLFDLLKRKYPDILCWMIRNAPGDKGNFNYDWESKKQRFWEDNGFVFYTDARYNQFIKMMKPHDEVYNGSKYRFALLDGSMNDVSFRFFGLNNLDFYDGAMPNCRFTDVNFSQALVYDTWMAGSRFYASGLNESDFRYTNFDRSTFASGSFEGCSIAGCNLKGLTIDGILVEDALKCYRAQEKQA